MKRLLLLIVPALLVGCEPPAQQEPPHRSLADDLSQFARYSPDADRFKLTDTKDGLRLFDGVTADIWLWKESATNWTKLPNPFRQENP